MGHGFLLQTIQRALAIAALFLLSSCFEFSAELPKDANSSTASTRTQVGGNLLSFQITKTLEAGSCAQLEARSLTGQSLTVSADNFTAADLYSDGNCLTSFANSGKSNTFSISATGTTVVYFSKRVPGNYSFVVRANGVPYSSSYVVTPAAPTKVALSLPSMISVGDCFDANLQFYDAYGNQTALRAAEVLQFSSQFPETGGIYTRACNGSLLQSLTVPLGTLVYPVSVRANGTLAGDGVVGIYSQTFGSVGVKTTVVGDPIPIFQLVAPSTSVTVDTPSKASCAPVELRLRQGANAYSPPQALQISINPSSQLIVASDSGCTKIVGSINLPANGASNTQLYVKSSYPGTRVLTVSAPGFTSLSLPFQFAAGAPHHMVLGGAPIGSVTKCYVATVELRDENENPTTPQGVFVGGKVALSGVAGTLTSGASCPMTTPPVGDATFSWTSDATQQTVAVRPTGLGIARLTATVTAVPSAQFEFTVNPIPPPFTTRIELTPSAFRAGDCISGQITLTKSGDPYPLTAATDFVLSHSASGQFYEDAGCSKAITKVSFASGQSQAGFYFSSTGSESPAVASSIATSINGYGTVDNTSVTISRGVPKQLALLGPAGATQYTPFQMSVEVRDVGNNFTSVPAGSTISVNLNSDKNVKFFDNTAGTAVPITSVSIAAGQGSVSFYARASKINSNVITAAAAAPWAALVPAQRSIFVSAAETLVLRADLKSTPIAGTCIPVQLGMYQGTRLADWFDDVKVTVGTSPASGTFFLTSCTGSPKSSVTVDMTPSANPVTVYLRGELSGAYQMAAVSSGTGGTANNNFTMLPGPPAFIEPTPSYGPAEIVAAVCQGPYKLQLRDSFGNMSYSSTDFNGTSVATTTNGAATSEQPKVLSSCSMANASNSLQVLFKANSSYSSDFYLYKATAGTIPLNGSAASIASGAGRSIGVFERPILAFVNPNTQAEFTTLNLGSVYAPQTSNPTTILIRNKSKSDSLEIKSMALSSIFSLSLPASTPSYTACSSINGGFVLGPERSCALNVTMQSSNPNTYSGEMSTTTSFKGIDANVTLPLSGTVMPQPYPKLTAVNASDVPISNTIDFNSVNTGSTDSKTIYVKNTGNAATTSIQLSISSPMSLDSSQCGNLSPGASCPVTIFFSPTSSMWVSRNLNATYSPGPNGSSSQNGTLVTVTGRGN